MPLAVFLPVALLAASHVAGQGAPISPYFPDCTNGPLANNTVCNKNASILARAQALVAAFTLDEKFNLAGSTSPGVPRLGLPQYQWWSEALHGVADSPGVHFNASGEYSVATSFPQPSLMGSAFDDELINMVGIVVSTEARAYSNQGRAGLDFWTPNINPLRDPRWGRAQEVPSEDPYHIRRYVDALINGLQGGREPETLKVVATCKHYAAYDLESWGGNDRTVFDAQVAPQDLAEYFMQPFIQCARDSRVASIMCSYNSLNGVPTCADDYILQDLLRSHWNWTQDFNYVTSDCDAIEAVYGTHRYSSSREQAVADTLTAGTDLDCGTYYQFNLPRSFDHGLYNETVLDQALVRLYSALVKLGYFDGDSASYRNITYSDVNTPAAQALALKAVEESVILFKNDGLLPWNPPADKTTNIALIGNWANTTNNTQLQGNYFGVAPYLHGINYGASQLPNVNVTVDGGVGGNGDPTTNAWLTTIAVANASDLIIYAAGTTISDAEEGSDRYTVSWSGQTVDQVNYLAALGKPTILIAMGDQLDQSPFLNNPNISAIVWGGYPGQSGGDAIFNVLTGKVAPAGRLSTTQYPGAYVFDVPMTDMSLRPNSTTGNPGRTYRWYNNATLPFGFGLHYTNFTTSFGDSNVPSATGSLANSSHDISTLVSRCRSQSQTYPYLERCPFTTVPVTVQNTGTTNVSSDFVTLAFIAGEFGPRPFPLKSLVAYQRLFNVSANAPQTAQLNLTLASLARFDEQGNQVLYPGNYSLLIDVPTQTRLDFTLTGAATTIDAWPVNNRSSTSRTARKITKVV